MKQTDNFEMTADTTAKLGDILVELMDKKLEPQQELYSTVYRALQQLLSPELAEHCRIGSIANGQLGIITDSSYMYQLRLYSSDLITGLKILCPHLRIARIKITAGVVSA